MCVVCWELESIDSWLIAANHAKLLRISGKFADGTEEAVVVVGVVVDDDEDEEAEEETDDPSLTRDLVELFVRTGKE